VKSPVWGEKKKTAVTEGQKKKKHKGEERQGELLAH
jgi:hypothetical protein